MSVYVGKLFRVIHSSKRLLGRYGKSKWPFQTASHMFADTDEELHKLAQGIGLGRSWFQNEINKMPHYDLTEGMRKKALKAGALEADQQVEVYYIRMARL